HGAKGELAPAGLCALMAAPGLAGLSLTQLDTPRARTLLMLLWGVAAALTCVLSGGLASPLAIWCLAPLAASVTFGQSARIAQGAALSLFAAAVAALANLTGAAGLPPAGPAATWLGLAAVLTIGAGLAAGLILNARRAARREQDARAAEAPLEQILHEQPLLILNLDGAGVIAGSYGPPPQGLEGRAVAGVSLPELAALPGRSTLRNAIRDASLSGFAEADFAPAGAPDRICRLTIRRGATGFAAVIRDASRERWHEAELEAARAEAESLNAGKSRFLANMSHELRTPLNAVMGFSDVMKAKLFGDMSPRYVEYAEMIHESGRHLLDLINDVLDMSKIEAERYQLSEEDFDAREAVSAALRLVRLQADTAGVSLRGVLPPASLEVCADRRALKQIVLNLVSNALKFTPRGGSITVMAQASGRDLELSVADTGVGISAEDLERLGRPYEQAGDAGQRSQGTGLGLSLVRAFAELHGGAMSLESALGEGTSVTVRLPVMHVENGAPNGGKTAKIIPLNVERR
ncbi:MAG: sensor histidine kinase, partial [Caulobacteraceae bacterium]